MTAASVSAGTDVLRHCDLNDLSRTAVERLSNRSRIVVVTTEIGRGDYTSKDVVHSTT